MYQYIIETRVVHVSHPYMKHTYGWLEAETSDLFQTQYVYHEFIIGGVAICLAVKHWNSTWEELGFEFAIVDYEMYILPLV